MLNDGYADIIDRLLKHAEEDLKAAKVLYDNELMLQSLYHLEQASEKILKAYLIGVLLYPMKLIVDNAESLGTAGKFRDIHGWLKSSIYNNIVPKNLGHAFSGFMKEFLPHLYKGYCSGRLIDYVNATLRAWLPRVRMSKERIIAKLVEQGATKEVAEKVYNLLINVLSQPAPIAIGEDIRRKSCEKARSDFGASLEKLGDEEKPCLQAAALLVEYVEELAEKAYTQVTTEYRGLLGQKIGEVLEAVGLSDILPRDLLEETIEYLLRKFVIGNIVIYTTLPLHFCLLKYYNATRYGEGTVPKEEFEAIPNTIKTLNRLHELTRTLILLSLQDQPAGPRRIQVDASPLGIAGRLAST